MNSLHQNLGGLAAGTLVTTPDGDKKIEEIKAGDLVLSGVGYNQTRSFKVKNVSSKSYHGPLLRITTDSGHQFRATPNHICFGVLDGDKVGKDSISLIAFNAAKPNRLLHIVWKPKELLEKFNNLDRAEDAAHRIAQQNGGAEIERFAEFTFGESSDDPFDESNEPFRFMPATDLKVSMKLPVTKNEAIEQATITNITEEQYDGLVYDLDIPEARNFAANGVLVHDSTRAF